MSDTPRTFLEHQARESAEFINAYVERILKPKQDHDRHIRAVKTAVCRTFNTKIEQELTRSGLDFAFSILATPDDFYIVEFKFTLGHWKAMVSTDIVDGYYYEATFHSDKEEIYVDEYIKNLNVCFPVVFDH